MPRAFECPSSSREADPHFDAPTEAGDLGTAVHEALQLYSAGERVPLKELAMKHRVERDDLGILYHYGKRAYDALVRHFPSPRAEVDVEGPVSMGTVDLFQDDPENDRHVYLDWKSGRIRKNHDRQLQGYASAGRETFGRREKYTTVTVWLRFNEYEVVNHDNESLDQFERDYERVLEESANRYSPGEWCGYCPHQLTCRAFEGWKRSGAMVLVESAGTDITPDLLARLYPQAMEVEKALKVFKKAVRLELQNGDLPLSEKKALHLGSVRRFQIDPQRAWPVLKKLGFSDDEINRTLSMRKSKIEEVIAEKAAHGLKAKKKARALEDLEEAGALFTYEETRIQHVNRKKENEEH